MADPKETAGKLVNGTFEVLEGDNAFKAQVAAGIVDELFGSDTHALVRTIPGIPESLFETISDGLVAALEGAVLKRLNGEAPPA
jgi:hypothetical protein